MIQTIINKYNIDLTKLKRNYLTNPLKFGYGPHNSEVPDIDDYKYLYLELNIPIFDILEFFGAKNKDFVTKLNKRFNIKKSTKSIVDSRNKTKQEKYGNSKYNNREKSKLTSLKNYGVDNYFKSNQLKDLNKNNLEERKFKEYFTKKLHNSFNKSKPEEEIYNLLLTKYPDTVSQYRSNQYPFNCDFYIPSLDVYIEINFHWTHGFHPFNENCLEDIAALNKWKEKSEEINFKGNKKLLYKNAIYTWTNLDVRKRKIAKANGLNYYVFYNKEQFLEWFKPYNII